MTLKLVRDRQEYWKAWRAEFSVGEKVMATTDQHGTKVGAMREALQMATSRGYIVDGVPFPAMCEVRL